MGWGVIAEDLQPASEVTRGMDCGTHLSVSEREGRGRQGSWTALLAAQKREDLCMGSSEMPPGCAVGVKTPCLGERSDRGTGGCDWLGPRPLGGQGPWQELAPGEETISSLSPVPSYRLPRGLPTPKPSCFILLQAAQWAKAAALLHWLSTARLPKSGC